MYGGLVVSVVIPASVPGSNLGTVLPEGAADHTEILYK